MPEFKVLGATEVRCGRHDCTPAPAKLRQVLALLLLRADTIVPMETIIEELWGDEPPRSAVPTAQTYIYQLRKSSGDQVAPQHRHDWLLTRPPGYQLRLAESRLDSTLFESKVRRARGALEGGRPGEAAELLQQALALWAGPALVGLTKGRHLDAHAFHLEELRMQALELSVQAGFAIGRERQLVGELRALTGQYPLNEWFHGRLIAALAICGRRGEALRAYHDLRHLLDRELGLGPSGEIERLHANILRDLPLLTRT